MHTVPEFGGTSIIVAVLMDLRHDLVRGPRGYIVPVYVGGG